MKQTIPQAVEEYLSDKKDFVFGGQIARAVGWKLGKKESNVERRLREMQNEGVLENRMVQVNGKGNKVVVYKLKVKENLFD